jgi:UDP-N-acetyl-D-mannosaminuronic acid dehydrogenase
MSTRFERLDFSDRDSLAGTTVAVFGLGKIGLPMAADEGATVRGVDIDSSVVEAVNDGRTPVDEPGLSELVAAHGGDGLVATEDGVAAARAADISVLLVPTLVTDGKPDLSALVAAADDVGAGLEPGDLVAVESTVPPGTTAGLVRERLDTDLVPGEEFALAHCPERTSAGTVITDLTESYPKVVGGVGPTSTAAAASFYRVFNEPGVIEMGDATSAEAVKVFEGVYRDVNIALANELGRACEEWGLDADRVFAAANSQPYCDLHDAGCGVGGHCIPVYPQFVTDRFDDASLVRTARSVNDGMPRHTADLAADGVRNAGTDPAEARALVLGLTYRPDVAETRFAPTYGLVDRLRERGLTTYLHDPLVDEATLAETGATPVTEPSAVADVDVIVLATAHSVYDDLDLTGLRTTDTAVLVDGRRGFDQDRVEKAGLTYVAVGDGTSAVPTRRWGRPGDQV